MRAAHLYPRDWLVASLMKTCLYSGRAELALQLLTPDYLASRGNIKLYTMAITALSKLGKWEEALAVWDSMIKGGIKPDKARRTNRSSSRWKEGNIMDADIWLSTLCSCCYYWFNYRWCMQRPLPPVEGQASGRKPSISSMMPVVVGYAPTLSLLMPSSRPVGKLVG